MKWQKNALPERFERFARNVFDVEGADAGIRALISWYEKIGAPVTLEQGHIPVEDIPLLVEKLSEVASLWGAESFYTKEMITNVLENARELL